MDSELKEAATKLAHYIHDQGFEAVVVSGGSNAVAKSLLYGAWRTEFPNEKVPHTLTIPADGNSLLYKYTAIDEQDRTERVTEWMETNLPELLELKEARICIVDEFAVTGEKAKELIQTFEGLGFTNTELALFAASENAELSENVFVGVENNELVTRLWKAASRIQGHPFIEDSEVPEGNKKEIRDRGLDDLREMMGEIRK